MTRTAAPTPDLRAVFVLAVVLPCASTALAAQGRPADLILHHGKIVTVDDAFSLRQAVVVRGGRIVAVGGDSLVGRYQAARVIDLRGRTVLPGFNDTHIHITGNPARDVPLESTRSVAEIVAGVRAMAGRLGPGAWITGYGWSEDQLAEHRRVLRADLDSAAPANPVVLVRAGGHSAVANSRALANAGITRDSPDPERGVIEREASGELKGIVRERTDLLLQQVPPADVGELRDSFVRNLRICLARFSAMCSPSQGQIWSKQSANSS